jgi:hypothetical protein
VTRAQKLLLTLSTFLVALTGIVYAVLKYLGEDLARRWPSLFPAADDAFTAIHHPLEPWALDLHVLAAPALVFAFGWIFKDHILSKLLLSGVPARRSGVAGVVLFVPMALSGYLLQVVTRESLHAPLVVVHLTTGGLFAAVYVTHVLLAPKRPRNGGVVAGMRLH